MGYEDLLTPPTAISGNDLDIKSKTNLEKPIDAEQEKKFRNKLMQPGKEFDYMGKKIWHYLYRLSDWLYRSEISDREFFNPKQLKQIRKMVTNGSFIYVVCKTAKCAILVRALQQYKRSTQVQPALLNDTQKLLDIYCDNPNFIH